MRALPLPALIVTFPTAPAASEDCGVVRISARSATSAGPLTRLSLASLQAFIRVSDSHFPQR
jgi:hypothetical protein